MNPTKEELIELARWFEYDTKPPKSSVALDLIHEICEAHGSVAHTHSADAYSLALDGEDVEDLL